MRKQKTWAGVLSALSLAGCLHAPVVVPEPLKEDGFHVEGSVNPVPRPLGAGAERGTRLGQLGAAQEMSGLLDAEETVLRAMLSSFNWQLGSYRVLGMQLGACRLGPRCLTFIISDGSDQGRRGWCEARSGNVPLQRCEMEALDANPAQPVRLTVMQHPRPKRGQVLGTLAHAGGTLQLQPDAVPEPAPALSSGPIYQGLVLQEGSTPVGIIGLTARDGIWGRAASAPEERWALVSGAAALHASTWWRQAERDIRQERMGYEAPASAGELPKLNALEDDVPGESKKGR